MKLGLRGQLFMASAVVITVAITGSGLYLATKLQDRLQSSIESELRRGALLARETVRWRNNENIESHDSLADSMGRDFAARVTIIAHDGRVLGDSTLNRDQVRTIENHGKRPEILQAYAGSVGVSQRYSTTAKQMMLYVAVPATTPEGPVVRFSRGLDEVQASVAQLRLAIVAAALVGIVIAMGLTALASQLFYTRFGTLLSRARQMGKDAVGMRIEVSREDEIGGIAGSFNKMAEDLEGTLRVLASERGRLAAVLEGMAEAVVALDRSSRIELVNPRAIQVMGLSQSPIGKTLLETVREPALQEITAAAQGGESASSEFELPGSRLRVLATATPRPGGSGCVIVFHDVTDVRRLEQIRRDFVSNVSHELRTPVAVIRANAETLADARDRGEDPERTRPLMDALLRHAERLSRILDDLLDLARLEAAGRSIDLQPINIRQVADTVLRNTKEIASQRDTTIELAIADELYAMGNDKGLEQVLTNLIENAAKYSPPGSMVQVSASEDDQGVRIAVRDNGPGIHASHRDRVFERFYRVDTGRSRDLGGTGLGLAIVKHLAESMGGEVGLEPAESGGSIFWICLQSTPETKSAPADFAPSDDPQPTAS